MADGQPKVCMDAEPEIMIKIIDNVIESNEREINKEREAREEEEQQPEDDSPGTVDIHTPEAENNQEQQGETGVSTLEN